jgi:hypothetical protein
MDEATSDNDAFSAAALRVKMHLPTALSAIAYILRDLESTTEAQIVIDSVFDMLGSRRAKQWLLYCTQTKHPNEGSNISYEAFIYPNASGKIEVEAVGLIKSILNSLATINSRVLESAENVARLHTVLGGLGAWEEAFGGAAMSDLRRLLGVAASMVESNSDTEATLSDLIRSCQASVTVLFGGKTRAVQQEIHPELARVLFGCACFLQSSKECLRDTSNRCIQDKDGVRRSSRLSEEGGGGKYMRVCDENKIQRHLDDCVENFCSKVGFYVGLSWYVRQLDTLITYCEYLYMRYSGCLMQQQTNPKSKPANFAIKDLDTLALSLHALRSIFSGYCEFHSNSDENKNLSLLPVERCRVCGPECGKEKRPLFRCTRCRAAAYCSLEHQRIDWPAHKVHCRHYLSDEGVDGMGYVSKHRADFVEECSLIVDLSMRCLALSYGVASVDTMSSIFIPFDILSAAALVSSDALEALCSHSGNETKTHLKLLPNLIYFLLRMRSSSESGEKSTASSCLERLARSFRFSSVDHCIAAHATFIVDKVAINVRAVKCHFWPKEFCVLNELLISMIHSQRFNRDTFSMPVLDSILDLLFIFVDFGDIRINTEYVESFEGLLVVIELLRACTAEIFVGRRNDNSANNVQADNFCSTFEICDIIDDSKDSNSFSPSGAASTGIGCESKLDDSTAHSDDVSDCAEHVDRVLESIVDRLLVAVGAMGTRTFGAIAQANAYTLCDVMCAADVISAFFTQNKILRAICGALCGILSTEYDSVLIIYFFLY